MTTWNLPQLAAFLFRDMPMQTTEVTKAIDTIFTASVDKLIIVFGLVIAVLVVILVWSNRNLVNNLMAQQSKRDEEQYKDKARLQDEIDERDKRSVERHDEFMALTK